MANTLTDLMETHILPLALVQLREACVLPALVHRDFSSEQFEYKSTIRIPKPQDMGTADDMATDIAASGTTSENLDDEYVDITLDQWKYKQFQMSDKEVFESVSKAVLPSAASGAVKVLANYIDSALLNLYKDIPYFYGAAGVTPSSNKDIVGVRKVLQNNLVPTDQRRLVLDTEAEAEFLNQWSDVSKVGSTAALIQASMGTKFGFDLFADQLVPSHTCGTAQAVEALAVNGVVAAGATTMNIDGGSGAETIKDGDLFTVDGVDGQFVFTADKTAAAGAITGATFYPAAPTGGFPNDALITIKAGHVPNMAFHRDAFALAMRKLGADKVESESSLIATQADPVSGISLRLESWRKPEYATRYYRFDILFGVKTLREELAARLLG